MKAEPLLFIYSMLIITIMIWVYSVLLERNTPVIMADISVHWGEFRKWLCCDSKTPPSKPRQLFRGYDQWFILLLAFMGCWCLDYTGILIKEYIYLPSKYAQVDHSSTMVVFLRFQIASAGKMWHHRRAASGGKTINW